MANQPVHLAAVSLICITVLPNIVHLATDWTAQPLHPEHIPYFFRNNPTLQEECIASPDCPYKLLANLTEKKCWGYEKGCKKKFLMSYPKCFSDAHGWGMNRHEQRKEFWRTADFGYVKEKRKELKFICTPQNEDDSSLECVRHTRYCRGKNIFMDFTNVDLTNSRDRFDEDILPKGTVGGHCDLDHAALQAEGDHKSPLQSWFAELEHFTSLTVQPLKSKICDIIFDKPTFFIKLDAGINMYHHFCDFMNLYVSQHLNNSFTTDINIIVWDTSHMGYSDFFSDTWKAFTRNPIKYLKQLEGKKVCFRDAVFPLLARMRYGLYYNMPLIPGCQSSSLVRAFSQHILHRLNVPDRDKMDKRVSITLLSRSTAYRKILNEDELVAALKTLGNVYVRKVDLSHSMPFVEQLKISHTSDIFIGMHGAGLTHMLFQPDWGVIMEIYNCEDAGCYYDLARLRGLKYITWEKKEKLFQEDEGHHPTLGAHAKFTNYSFDVSEFMRLVLHAIEHVLAQRDIFAMERPVSSQETESAQKDEL